MASSVWVTIGVLLDSAKELDASAQNDTRALISSLVESVVAKCPDLERDVSALGRLRLACENIVSLHLHAPLGKDSASDAISRSSDSLARGGFGGGGGGGGGRIGGGGGGRSAPAIARATAPVMPRAIAPVAPRSGSAWRMSPASRIRALTGPRSIPRARLPSGYRLGRPRVTAPYRWMGSTVRPYRIGPTGGYIYRPYGGFRPWRSYGGFLGFLGLGLSSWLMYPWFRLWYYSYMGNPMGYNFYGPSPYYSVPAPGMVSGLPELGYVDFRTWTPEQIDEHIRELEMIYAATVAAGYRIVPDPSAGRLNWVYNVTIPGQGATV